MLNGDNDRGIGPKSRGFQPVALEVQAGAAAVIAGHIMSVGVAGASASGHRNASGKTLVTC